MVAVQQLPLHLVAACFQTPNLSSGFAGMPKSPDRSLRLISSICSCTASLWLNRKRQENGLLSHNKEAKKCNQVYVSDGPKKYFHCF